MPEEVAIIAVVAIVMGTLSGIIKSVLKYNQQKWQARNQSMAALQDNSLTTSELNRMIGQAVEAATVPLLDKIEVLERRLDRLPTAAPERPLLEESAEAPAARRSRSH
jgi:hypothetical protein